MAQAIAVACPVSISRRVRSGLVGPRRVHNTQCRAIGSSVGDKLWALDFDGVICDSCGESSLSAWKAAAVVWPEFMSSPSVMERKEKILEDMRTVRPVVETGYENIVQIRCLLEGVSAEQMLEDWGGILQEYMKEWDLNRAELVDLFGTTRDNWMAADLQSWLAPNKIYDGLPPALKHAMENEEVYIVTTKQARFTAALLKDMAGIEFPMERIFSTTVSGQPKTEVLAQLEEKHPGRRCLFIEDKVSTLYKVCKVEGLSSWELYLADWGYNTAQERQTASQNSRIKIVGLVEFQELLASGVLSS